MSKEILSYDQKEIEIDNKLYIIQAMGAEYGMTVMDEMVEAGGKFSTKRMIDIIKRSVTYGGKLFDDKTFNVHFSRKYQEIGKLFEEILAFNFPVGEAEEGTNPLELLEGQEDITGR